MEKRIYLITTIHLTFPDMGGDEFDLDLGLKKKKKKKKPVDVSALENDLNVMNLGEGEKGEDAIDEVAEEVSGKEDDNDDDVSE